MDSIETVEVRSVIGLVVAVNVSDWERSLEPSLESNDVAIGCSKLGADLALSVHSS